MLALVDISEGARLRRPAWERGATVSSHTADLTSHDEVEKVVNEALAAHCRIDVLVNNAGMVICG